MYNCTVIGLGADIAKETAEGVLVFGDFTIAQANDDVAVGHRIMGNPIPESVRKMILDNPRDAHWLIRAMCDLTTNAIVENLNHEREQQYTFRRALLQPTKQ